MWYSFINTTIGWAQMPLCFLLGLINPSYGFGGLDGAIHPAEDCFEPAETVPPSTLVSPSIRFHDGFLPGRLDPVLREGHLRSNKPSKRVSLAIALNRRW